MLHTLGTRYKQSLFMIEKALNCSVQHSTTNNCWSTIPTVLLVQPSFWEQYFAFELWIIQRIPNSKNNWHTDKKINTENKNQINDFRNIQTLNMPTNPIQNRDNCYTGVDVHWNAYTLLHYYTCMLMQRKRKTANAFIEEWRMKLNTLWFPLQTMNYDHFNAINLNFTTIVRFCSLSYTSFCRYPFFPSWVSCFSYRLTVTDCK